MYPRSLYRLPDSDDLWVKHAVGVSTTSFLPLAVWVQFRLIGSAHGEVEPHTHTSVVKFLSIS